jgi:hypothetical protein
MMTHLIIQAHTELKVMLGAPGDVITADRANTQTRGCQRWPCRQNEHQSQQNQPHNQQYKLADLAHPASSKGR